MGYPREEAPGASLLSPPPTLRSLPDAEKGAILAWGPQSTALAASNPSLPFLAAGAARCRTTPRAAGLGRGALPSASPAVGPAGAAGTRRPPFPEPLCRRAGAASAREASGLRRQQLRRLPPLRRQRAGRELRTPLRRFQPSFFGAESGLSILFDWSTCLSPYGLPS